MTWGTHISGIQKKLDDQKMDLFDYISFDYFSLQIIAI